MSGAQLNLGSCTTLGRRVRPRLSTVTHAAQDSKPKGRPRKPNKAPKGAPPSLTPSGDPLSEWTMDNRKELAAFMVDPQKDDLFDETDFPSLALEEEDAEDDYDAHRKAQLYSKFYSQAPIIFSQEVDDPRLRWKGHVVEWVQEEPRYQTLEEEAREWFWELEVESQRAEAMRLHQKHRELGASQFGLANAMGSIMQKMEEEDVENKTEEYAIPSWIRANIKLEENWDRFERAQRQAEGGTDLINSWSEELEKKGVPDMLARWAPELLEGDKDEPQQSTAIDTYLRGTLPGADEEPEEGEIVYEPQERPQDEEDSLSETYETAALWPALYMEDGVSTPAVDQGMPGDLDEENDPLGKAMNEKFESDTAPNDIDDDDD